MLRSIYLFIKQDSLLVRVVMLLRLPLILGLSTASGYTTYNGLMMFVPVFWISLLLTVAVQSLIVIGSYQLTKISWRVSLLQFLGVFGSLILAATVSVFFSYFTFYRNFEEFHLRQSQFVTLKTPIYAFCKSVHDAKNKLVSDQQKKIATSNSRAIEEALGRLKDGSKKIGTGSMYHFLKKETENEYNILQQLKNSNEAERSIAKLETFLATLTPMDFLNRGEKKYGDLQMLIGDAIVAANQFGSNNGLPAFAQPELMSYEKYNNLKPSLQDLAHISPLAIFLALAFDLFTFFIMISYERIPYGHLRKEMWFHVVKTIMEYSDWKINQNNQLEFQDIKTQYEISTAYNDGERKHWTWQLLNLGYLRKIDSTRIEFTPRLLELFGEILLPPQEDKQNAINEDPRIDAI